MKKEGKIIEFRDEELTSCDFWPLLREIEERNWLSRLTVSRNEGSFSIELASEDCVPAVVELAEAYLRGGATGLKAGAAGADAAHELPDTATVRIERETIDKLLSLTGELIVASNGIAHLARRLEGSGLPLEVVRQFKEYQNALNRVGWEIQDLVMEMRLMPVGLVFERFRRVVRELAQELGKKVRLSVQGEEVAVDRNVAATIYEPLLHLVRNAIDHGLERPEERARSGKQEEGELILRAERSGERVIIAVRDDGAGVDVEAVKRKAVAGGLIGQEEAEKMTETEALQLLFVPGFSTKDRVSQVSGRGVGMDVVRETVEGLGGRVVLTSERGSGTEVRMELPITMSITRVLLIEWRGNLYGIPVSEVKEIVRLPATRLHALKGREVVSLREGTCQVVRLSRLFGDTATDRADEVTLLVLLRGIAVVVPKVLGQEDVVLRSLPAQLAGTGLFSNAAVLGNGDIALVLDSGLLAKAG